jgi:cell division protein FtsN
VAAKRGKSQARRSGGGGGTSLPGWAWLVLGVLLTMVVVIVAPKYLKSSGDGFFRPQPNPDAQPAPIAEDEDAVAPEGDVPAPKHAKGKNAGKTDGEDYDFYTLLPGKEVPLSDAEIAATEQAEARREAARLKQAQASAPIETNTTEPATALPKPVDNADTAATSPRPTKPVAAATPSIATKPDTAPTSTNVAASVDDNTRYLLQAGAFQASGQAEELKAKIALLGLGARVEAADIKGNTVYRVRMGPYGTASDLAEAKRKLSAGGLAAMAIKVK